MSSNVFLVNVEEVWIIKILVVVIGVYLICFIFVVIINLIEMV